MILDGIGKSQASPAIPLRAFIISKMEQNITMSSANAANTSFTAMDDAFEDKLMKRKIFNLTKRKKLNDDEKKTLLDHHHTTNGHDESVFENYMKHDGSDISFLEELLQKSPATKVEDALVLCLRYAKAPAKEKKVTWWLKKIQSLDPSERTLVREKHEYHPRHRESFMYFLFVTRGRRGTVGRLQKLTDLEFTCLQTLINHKIISNVVDHSWVQPYCHVKTYEQLLWMMDHMEFPPISGASGGITWNCLFHHMDKRIVECALQRAMSDKHWSTQAVDLRDLPFQRILSCDDYDFAKRMLQKDTIRDHMANLVVNNRIMHGVLPEIEELVKELFNLDLNCTSDNCERYFYCIHDGEEDKYRIE